MSGGPIPGAQFTVPMHAPIPLAIETEHQNDCTAFAAVPVTAGYAFYFDILRYLRFRSATLQLLLRPQLYPASLVSVRRGIPQLFVNVVTSPKITRPKSTPSCKNGKGGEMWSLPHAVGPMRLEKDKGEAGKDVQEYLFVVVKHGCRKKENCRIGRYSRTLGSVGRFEDCTRIVPVLRLR